MMRPAVRLHLLRDQLGGLALVEALRSLLRDPLERVARGPAASGGRPSRTARRRARTGRARPGSFFIRGSTSRSERARPSLTMKPSRASAIAGSSRRLPRQPGPCPAQASVQARRPCRARPPRGGCRGGAPRRTCRPSRNIVGVARARAPSRGSRRRRPLPLAGRSSRKPPPPMLPAAGCTTASAKAVGDRGVDRVAAVRQHRLDADLRGDARSARRPSRSAARTGALPAWRAARGRRPASAARRATRRVASW